MLAGLQGGDRDLGVAVAGGTDVDQVDVGAFDQAPPLGLGRGEAEPLGRGAHRLRVTAGDRGQFGGERQVEEPVGIAPGLGVGGAHEGVPHHADPQDVTHLSSPFSSPAGTARLALPITSCTDGQDASAAASSGRCSAVSAWR